MTLRLFNEIIIPISLVLLLEFFFADTPNSLQKIRQSGKYRREELFSWFTIFLKTLTPINNILTFWMLHKVINYGRINTLDLFDKLNAVNVVFSFLVFILVYDLLLYWLHRAKHSSDILWITHRFHHTPKIMTLFSSNRNHFLNWIFQTLLFKLPIVLIFGQNIYSLVIFWFVYEVSQILTHSSIDTGYGMFGHIIASPRFHILHHSKKGLRSNYGLLFSFWDRLFGTFQENKTIKNLDLGINDKLYDENKFIKAYFLEFKELFFQLIKDKKNITITLLALFSFSYFVKMINDKNEGEHEVWKLVEQVWFKGPASCAANFSKEICSKVVGYTDLDKKINRELTVYSHLLNGTYYDWANLCDKDVTLCKLVDSILYDKGSCKGIPQEDLVICNNSREFYAKKCDSISDQYLKSICLNYPTNPCQKDLVCFSSFILAKSSNPETIQSLGGVISHNYKEVVQDKKRQLNEISKLFKYKNEKIINVKKENPFSVLNNEKGKLPIGDTSSGFRFVDFYSDSLESRSSPLYYLQPWRRGTGMTAHDWDGDGLKDLFFVRNEILYFYHNIQGKTFNKHILSFANVANTPALLDVSVVTGIEKKILVQQYPNLIYLLSFVKGMSHFKVEKIQLPNSSRTHAIVGSKVILPEWSGIKEPKGEGHKSGDIVFDIDSRKITLLKGKGGANLGISILGDKEKKIFISEDLSTQSRMYQFDNFKPLQVPKGFPYISHSTSVLKKRKLFFTSGLSFSSRIKGGTKRSIPSRIKEISLCKKEKNKNACYHSLIKSITYRLEFLCKSLKSPNREVCHTQHSRAMTKQINHKHLNWKPSVFSQKGERYLINNEWTKAVRSMGQIWHISSAEFTNRFGFFALEGSLNLKKTRRLMWVGKKDGKEVHVEEIKISSNPNDSIDGANFILSDFNNDGLLDIAYLSRDNVFIKKGGEELRYKEYSKQQGFMARDL